MPAQKQKRISCGTCTLCNEKGIAKRAMLKHLLQCKERAVPESKERAFHILVSSPYDPRYWLHVEANESSTLRELDGFLRDIWLECCGHMSAFTIAQREYRYPGSTMRAKLDDILLPGMRFFHEYDFGSTTELILDVLAHDAPKARGKSVHLLARNEPIVFSCAQCRNQATTLCLECEEKIKGPEDEEIMFYCDRCVDEKSKHSHDEDMRLPVVNSPRIGICGYTGD